jgi:hypothetical protein
MSDQLPEPTGGSSAFEDPDPGGLGFDMLAASIRADASEMTSFLTVLGHKLFDALPGQVNCVRERKRFRESDRIKRVEVTLDELRFEVEENGAIPVAMISHVVRGMKLRSDEVALDEWIERLSRKLAEFAAKSAQARNAIGGLLG